MGYYRELWMVECSIEQLAEWTFEGSPKWTGIFRVGVVGNRTRYQSGVYGCTCESEREIR